VPQAKQPVRPLQLGKDTLEGHDLGRSAGGELVVKVAVIPICLHVLFQGLLTQDLVDHADGQAGRGEEVASGSQYRRNTLFAANSGRQHFNAVGEERMGVLP